MATLRMPHFSMVLRWFRRVDGELPDSRRAREFAHQVYTESGGASADLKRVYDSYLANERRRETLHPDGRDAG
jgi:hypothetical protein